jgi:hypothetical protein
MKNGQMWDSAGIPVYPKRPLRAFLNLRARI